jgi:predicted transcriptional regulator YheO
MTDGNKVVFDNFKRIAAVTVETFGRNCEVAIHDFDQLPHSLIYIKGNVTKRKVGAPVTDLVLRELRRKKDNVKDIANYKTVTKEGRILKSSTTFIRDGEDHVIGAFCINYDITEHLNAIAMLEDFVHTADSDEGENFATSFSETIETLMDRAVRQAKKQPAMMTKEEKVQLVKTLEFQGAFLIRGAVDYVAKALGVSKFTVYNYLKEART